MTGLPFAPSLRGAPRGPGGERERVSWRRRREADKEKEAT